MAEYREEALMMQAAETIVVIFQCARKQVS